MHHTFNSWLETNATVVELFINLKFLFACIFQKFARLCRYEVPDIYVLSIPRRWSGIITWVNDSDQKKKKWRFNEYKHYSISFTSNVRVIRLNKLCFTHGQSICLSLEALCNTVRRVMWFSGSVRSNLMFFFAAKINLAIVLERAFTYSFFY